MFEDKSKEELKKMLEEIYFAVEKLEKLSKEKDKIIDELIYQCNSLYNENQILKLKNS
jgi:hypothetical protein